MYFSCSNILVGIYFVLYIFCGFYWCGATTTKSFHSIPFRIVGLPTRLIPALWFSSTVVLAWIYFELIMCFLITYFVGNGCGATKTKCYQSSVISIPGLLNLLIHTKWFSYKILAWNNLFCMYFVNYWRGGYHFTKLSFYFFQYSRSSNSPQPRSIVHPN